MVASTIETALLAGHVAGGVVALVAGAVALLTEKGGDRHRLAGRVYVAAMAVVVGTVPVLLAFDPTSFGRQFLTLIAVFSGYLVFTGYRVLSRKRPTAEAAPVDWAAAVVVVVGAVGLGGWGLFLGADGRAIGSVMAVFGAIGATAGLNDLRGFRSSERRDPWVAAHLGRMLGGYIATVTAVAVVNLTGVLPPLVVWLGPTAVGVPLSLYWQASYADVGPFARGN